MGIDRFAGKMMPEEEPVLKELTMRSSARWVRTWTLVAMLTVLAACTQVLPGARTPVATPTALPATAMSPSPTEAPAVAVVQDAVYALPVAGTANVQMLDVYAPGAPQDAAAAHPVVVFAHGFGQTKAAMVTVSRELARQGAVVFTPSWPTDPSSAASWREMTEVMACAVRFARANAPAYGGDPDNLTLAGFSMGGGVGAFVALNAGHLDQLWKAYAASHDGPPQQAACAAADEPIAVRAFVGIAGAYTLADGFAQSNPDLYALLSQTDGTTDLKIALLQGEFDTTVPAEVAETFEGRLEAAGYAPTLTMYDSGHTVPRELTVQTVMDIAR